MKGRVGYSRGPFLFAEGAGLSLRVRELAQEVPDAVAEVRGGAGIHAGLFVPAPASPGGHSERAQGDRRFDSASHRGSRTYTWGSGATAGEPLNDILDDSRHRGALRRDLNQLPDRWTVIAHQTGHRAVHDHFSQTRKEQIVVRETLHRGHLSTRSVVGADGRRGRRPGGDRSCRRRDPRRSARRPGRA